MHHFTASRTDSSARHVVSSAPARGRRARQWLLAAVMAAPAAQACDGLGVDGAWIREPPPGKGTVAGYMHLRNTGSAALVIDAVSSPAYAMGMLHENVRDGDKVRMRHLDTLAIAAGDTVELAPGGLHLMLMRPVGPPPRAGDTVTVQLHCGAGVQTLSVPVRRDRP
jgi:copper(I)-binding protein